MQNDRPRGELQLDRYRAEQHLHDEQPEGDITGPARNGPLPTPHSPAPPPPDTGSKRRPERRHDGGDEPVAPLDQRGNVSERWDQPAVAYRPLVAAAQPRAGNADNAAEDDQEVRRGGGRPGKTAESTIHGPKNVI